MTRLLHRVLRRLLPREFRRDHGPSMEDVFVEAHRVARARGRRAVLALWIREVVDMARAGHAFRAEARRFGAGFVARGVGRRWTAERGGGRTMGILDDLRYAVRSLVRRPSLTLFAVVTLALGIGSTTAIFSTVESVVLNPLPFEKGDRIVGLFRQMGTSGAFLTPSHDDIAQWEELTELFEHYEPWTFRSMTLSGRGEAREVQSVLTGPGMFEMLGRSPLIGRAYTEEDRASGARVALLSHEFWTREFGGSREALGASVTLDGEPWSVIGVVPPDSPMPGWGVMSPELWRPLDLTQVQGGAPVSAVLREGITIEAVNERLAAVSEGESTRSTGAAVLIADQVGRNVRGYLKLLMGAVVLLLLVACVNVSNLLLFRANGRKRETAVRAALGGGRGRLTRQLLIESLVLAALGGMLGVAVAYLGQAAILELRPGRLDVLDRTSINGTVLLFTCVVTLLTGIVFGLVPAHQAGRPGALDPLRSGLRTEGDVVGRRLRWLLVSGEVALSFALLLGSFSVLQTLIARQRVEMGFQAGEVAVMGVAVPRWRYQESGDRNRVLEDLRDRLATLPEVVHVAQASGAPPAAGVWFGQLEVEGQEPSEETTLLHGPHVQPGYFEALGQRIVEGRGFTHDDALTGEALIILGETTAREFFPEGDVVGRRMRMGANDDWMTVVGVVADVPMVGLSSTSGEHQYYAPLDDWEGDTFLVRVGTAGDPATLLPLMKEVVASIDEDIRVDRLATAHDMLRDTLERERFATSLMSVFATLALLLAAIGLYGVVSQVVGQRTREIGIRVALGARRAGIASMVLRSAFGSVLAGVFVGFVLTLGLDGVLQSRVVELEGSSPAMYLGAAVALSVTALLAAYAPTRRATRVDPVDAIRTE